MKTIKTQVTDTLISKNGEMNIGVSNSALFTLNPHPVFEIDWRQVETIEDIKVILRALQINIHFWNGECPEQFKEIQENGFLIAK